MDLSLPISPIIEELQKALGSVRVTWYSDLATDSLVFKILDIHTNKQYHISLDRRFMYDASYLPHWVSSQTCRIKSIMAEDRSDWIEKTHSRTTYDGSEYGTLSGAFKSKKIESGSISADKITLGEIRGIHTPTYVDPSKWASSPTGAGIGAGISTEYEYKPGPSYDNFMKKEPVTPVAPEPTKEEVRAKYKDVKDFGIF